MPVVFDRSNSGGSGKKPDDKAKKPGKGVKAARTGSGGASSQNTVKMVVLCAIIVAALAITGMYLFGGSGGGSAPKASLAPSRIPAGAGPGASPLPAARPIMPGGMPGARPGMNSGPIAPGVGQPRPQQDTGDEGEAGGRM